MTPGQAKALLWAIVVGVLIAVFWIWLQARDARRDLEANAEQGVRTDQAASGIAQDAGVATGEQREQDAGVAEIRVVHQHTYEEVRRNDPIVRAWGDAPVPDRLRQLARERREARERLGCTGDGCGSDGAAEGARR